MLKIYPVVLRALSETVVVERRIASRDRDLARQLRRASQSAALNLGEGMYLEGGHRRQRYLTSLGSARETMSCLEVAAAVGYAQAGGELLARWNHVVAVLVKLTR